LDSRLYKLPPAQRRRAQNRASQRAYRERKDQRIKDLEDLLNESQQKNDVLGQAYAALQAEYIKLKNEQDTTAQLQRQGGLNFDPTMAASAADMDLFLYNDNTGYAM
jgi:AP-1-like factor